MAKNSTWLLQITSLLMVSMLVFATFGCQKAKSHPKATPAQGQPHRTEDAELCEKLRVEALKNGCVDMDAYFQLRHEQRVPLCGRNGVNPPVFMGDTLCSSL